MAPAYFDDTLGILPHKRMARPALLLASLSCLAAAQRHSNPFVVSTTANGAFSVTLPGWDGFALNSANDIGFQSNGKWLASGSGLTPSNYRSYSGSDS